MTNLIIFQTIFFNLYKRFLDEMTTAKRPGIPGKRQEMGRQPQGAVTTTDQSERRRDDTRHRH
jgi:hypothetical protein